jgi:hypothetical protein
MIRKAETGYKNVLNATGEKETNPAPALHKEQKVEPQANDQSRQ